jgi:repressor LexA
MSKLAVPPDPSTLTERQRLVLSFIEGHIRQHGFPPTIREIGRHLGIKSTNGVNDHLNALQKKGFLTREEGKSRTLQLTRGDTGGVNDNGDDVGHRPGLADFNDDIVDIPLLGRVAAGAPILAEENREDTVRVSSFFLGNNAHQKVFALTVVGDSMIEDGIFDGDYLFVKKQPVARTGEIVVAMIEGEATVKRYFPEGDRIRFQPANARLSPIFVEKSAFRQTDILGIVVGVYRKV